MPGIRPLAEELRVNRNTVAKAYSALESQGVIETIAGKGCFVRANHSPFKKEVRRKLLAETLDGAVIQAHHLRNRQGGLPACRRGALRRARAQAPRGELLNAYDPQQSRDRSPQPGPPLRTHRRRRRAEPCGAGRPVLRVFRQERRRKDDDDQVPVEPAAADERRGAGVADGSRARGSRCQVAHFLRPRLRRVLSVDDGPRRPRVLRVVSSEVEQRQERALLEQFRLDPRQKTSHLSKGQHTRQLALVIAVCPSPNC